MSKASLSGVSFLGILWKSLYYHLLGKQIFSYPGAYILGIRNIDTRGVLDIGTKRVAFLPQREATYLNIEGKLIIEGRVKISKGCQLFVQKGAVCVLRDCHLNAQVRMVVTQSLNVGERTTIAWNCEFLDNDLHEIEYENKRPKKAGIIIGRNVWIGAHVILLKGSRIPDGSVVAANSTVNSPFEGTNLLIAGNPAKVIRTGVKWK